MPAAILRSVRLLRLLCLARLATFAVEGIHEARGVLHRRGLSRVLLIVAALNVVAAALVLNFERDVPNVNIHSYPEALWWAVTNDHQGRVRRPVPHVPGRPGVAVLLMVAGITTFGIVTASIAAYFVEQRATRTSRAG